jgi:hypothetical protein
MTLFRRPLLLAVLPALAILPACGSETPAERREVLSAVIVVAVDPKPVPANQNTVTAQVSTTYTVTLTETAGLGGEMVFVNGTVYDPASGLLVAQNYYDASSLQVFVGKKRIEPKGSLTFTQTQSYTLPDLSRAATLVISAQFRDDYGNVINASTLASIQ